MTEFISEPLKPHTGTFDTAGMARGEPGLPSGFDWHDESYEVFEVLERWKQSGPEIGNFHGERYLRRHYFTARMSDGSTWTVYFERTTPRSGSPKRRWFLYTREPPETNVE